MTHPMLWPTYVFRYHTSGSLDGAKKGAYIATFSVADLKIVSTVTVAQPYWFLCPSPVS